MEAEKGMLLETIEPDDPNVRFKLLYMRYIVPLSGVAVTAFMAIAFWIIFDGDIPLEFIMVVAAWPFMELIAFMVVQFAIGKGAIPLRIYSSGLETFPCLAYRLRGLGHYISRDQVVEVQVKSDLTDPDRAAKGKYGVAPDQQPFSVRVKLSDGRSRVVATRKRDRAMSAAKRIGEAWAVPVVGTTAGL
jgi:hypothetical protein